MAKRKKEAPGVVTQLRDAILNDGRTLKEIGDAAGIDPSQLSRFVRGERDLTFANAEKVCRALRLQLATVGPAKVRAREPSD